MTTKTHEITFGEKLLRASPKGTKVYAVLRHVSNSGMLRHIDFFLMLDNEPVWITPAVRDVADYKQTKDGALKVHGTGMDMGFSVVYNLSSAMFGDGYYFKSEWI